MTVALPVSAAVTPPTEDVHMLVRGGVRAEALPLADAVVQTTVTSPPYWGQRDCGIWNARQTEASDA